MFHRRAARTVFRRARQRLGAWMRPGGDAAESHIELRIIPLEPRFVLNATAELNPLGQLLVSGTVDSDVVQLRIETGSTLSLLDGSGNPIPIANHPDGAGNETNPLDRDDVDEIRFEMNEGDDLLDLQIPRGIDVVVSPTAGTDEVRVDFAEFNPATTAESSVVEIHGESIQLFPAFGAVSFADASVHLDGQVAFGGAGLQSSVDVTRGEVIIDGRFVMRGDVAFVGTGLVDLSGATVSSDAIGSELSVAMGTSPTNRFLLGGADDSAGRVLGRLDIRSAGQVTLGPLPVTLAGDLRIQGVTGTVTFASTLSVDSVDVLTDGDIELLSPIETTAGGVTLATKGNLGVASEIDTTVGSTLGSIQLQADNIELDGAMLITSGGSVRVAGPVTIDGDVRIDTGNGQLAAVAGDVDFLFPIGATDGMKDTLRIDARANGTSGSVSLEGPVGSSVSTPALIDLNALSIDGDQAKISSVALAAGDIRINANAIQLTTGDLRTSLAGGISLNGPLLLPAGDTTIMAADQVLIGSSVRGQVGSRDLQVVAGSDVNFAGEVTGINNLSVTATNQARTQGMLALSGDLDVLADHIRIEASVDTTVGDPDGAIRLQGTSEVTVRQNAVLQSGLGSILIDADGGVIDTSQATLRSDASGLAITLRDASRLTIGNLLAPVGQVVLGVDRDLTGSTTQADKTSIVVDRLTASSASSIDLSNATNEVRLVEPIRSVGTVSLRDAVGDLAVVSIDSSGSDITVVADGTIGLSQRAIIAKGATARLTAGAEIVDVEQNAATNIEAELAELTAERGIGRMDPLETNIDRLIASLSGTGSLNLVERDALRIESLVTADGAIQVTSGQANASGALTIDGTMTARDIRSLGGNDRDITLRALGRASDIEVGQLLAAGDSDIHLHAGDDVLRIDDASSLQSDDLAVIAGNQSPDGILAIDLNTNVNDFQASVVGSNRGDIRIFEQDTIRLASSDDRADEIIETANGEIHIVAGQRIHVLDHSVADDGADRKGDPELVARGANGRIDLEVTSQQGEIELDQTVQLHAEKRTPDASFADPISQTSPLPLGLERQDRAVYLKAQSIQLGTGIEILTGEDQGTARVFAPRPLDLVPPGENEPFPDTDLVGDGNSAFFVASSVRTNILEQALVNDATGTLSLDLGQSGERGLSIDIDWGAPTVPGSPGEPERFQRIDGVDADIETFVDQDGTVSEQTVSTDARLSIEHFYTEANVLNSRANDRPAATNPFEVRFSVRHHASILVLGSQVRQVGPEEFVAGGVVSSTDDPSTQPLLENGRATFIIPSLSIPVAFFPTREVIPDIEPAEFVVRVDNPVELSQTVFETVEVSLAPNVGRDEYFQIRVLSPDPSGEDLAVLRLPDNILDGDKIKNLLSELPDGSYQIEYVLGDATQRTILRVDIRRGEATIPGESLDEGILRLKEVQRDAPPVDHQLLPAPPATDGKPVSGAESLDSGEAQGEFEEQPAEQDRLETPTESPPDLSFHNNLVPSLIPLVGGYTLSGAWSRRKRRPRFSQASAFADRYRQRESR